MCQSFSARVSRLRPESLQTHCQSPTKAFAFNINLSHVGISCNKQALCSIHVLSVLKFNRLLFVTFNIATIVCDDSDTASEKGEEGEWR